MSAVQGSSDVVQQQCVTRIFRCTTAAVGLGARIWVAGDAGVHAAQKLPLPTSSSTAAQISVGRSDQSETWLRCCAWSLQQAHGLHASVDVDVSQGRRGAKLSSSASSDVAVTHQRTGVRTGVASFRRGLGHLLLLTPHPCGGRRQRANPEAGGACRAREHRACTPRACQGVRRPSSRK